MNDFIPGLEDQHGKSGKAGGKRVTPEEAVVPTESVETVTPVPLPEEPATSEYFNHKSHLLSSLTVGRAAEWDNPALRPIVQSLTDEQIDWIASWLAGEGFGGRDSR